MQPTAAEPALASRLVREFTQTIHATPDRVFPLLCPVMEARWLKGWTYRMIHSRSGVAEHDAVFETPHANGRTLWLVTAHEPDSRVAFARWQPDDLVVTLDIHLEPLGPDQTRVHICYTWTSVGPLAVAAMGKLTEEAWRDNMVGWESSMNEWFENERSPATAGR